MAFIAFLGAVAKVLGAMNEIYTFVKNVQEFTSQEPKDEIRDRYLNAYAATIATRKELISACWNILSAIRQLDERIFRSLMADKLGDADQAMQDLEYWRRSGSIISRDLALDRSAGALADMLQLVSGGAYPALSLIFPHVQILAARLAVLAEGDPAFAKSPLTRQPITTGIAVIRSAVADLERAVVDANQIEVVERVTYGKRPKEGPRPEFHWVRVIYANASGTVSFNTEVGPSEDVTPDYSAAWQKARAAQERGIADDRTAARISELADAADRFDAIVRNSELRIFGGITGLVATPILRARYQLLRRDHDAAESLEVILADDATPGTGLDFSAASRELGRDGSGSDERLLQEVAQQFGQRAFLHLITNLLMDREPIEAVLEREVDSDGHTDEDRVDGRTRGAASGSGGGATGSHAAAGRTSDGTA